MPVFRSMSLRFKLLGRMTLPVSLVAVAVLALVYEAGVGVFWVIKGKRALLARGATARGSPVLAEGTDQSGDRWEQV